jgi:hypothetical protein
MAGNRPVFRCLLWHPAIVVFPFGYFVYRNFASGFGFSQTGGLAVASIWFALSIIDLLGNHRFVDWLYGPD